jgi:ribosomal protein L37AE/L43A
MRVVMRQTRSDMGTGNERMDDDDCGHLQCPFCHAYQVERLYIGSLHVDSCTCEACGARWDEDIETGRYRGRSSTESVIVPRHR